MDDRFSALSEELQFRILSFLDIEDLCQLIFVSRKCKLLCGSVPSLTIDNSKYTQDSISRQHFNKIVGKYIFLRAEYGIKMLQFTLVWSFRGIRPDLNKKRKKMDYHDDTEEDLVTDWLLELCHTGIERISVSMVPQEGSCNMFLCSAIYSTNVKDLTFYSNDCDFKFPRSFVPSGSYRGLESLKLHSARIVGNIDIGSAIGSLKSLSLYDCNGIESISIRSSSLKILEIINEKPVELLHLEISAANLEKIFLTWYPSDFLKTSFQFCSFALQEFVWNGYPVHFYYSSGNWSNLQCAALYLKLPPRTSVASFSEHDVQFVLPRFERSAKFLRLHAKTIEILFKLGHLTAQLAAMRNLAIEYCLLTNEQVPMIASFLKKISCLETFCLTSSSANVRDGTCTDEKLKVAAPSQGFVFSVKYWETQKLKFIDHLREASVEVHGEWGNAMEFVFYMVKHARGLQYLTIMCPTPSASSIQKRLIARMNEAICRTAHMNETLTKLTFSLKALN